MKCLIYTFAIRLMFFCMALVLLNSCAVKRKISLAEADDIEIKLPSRLQNPKLEFSSMSWANSNLLLVPQYPERFNNEIYTLKSADIIKFLETGKVIKREGVIKLINVDKIIKRIGVSYEGFEATAVIGNRIFFTIETDSANENNYLVGGILTKKAITLNSEKLVLLPKLKRLSNAGYESLAWLADRNKLIAFFEYNKADAGSRALLIDTTLSEKPVEIALKPLMFRITDVTAISKNRLLGVNFHYNGSRKEFGEYIGADSNMVLPAFNGRTLKQTSYSRIIEFNISSTEITWQAKRDISLKNENWEGIVPFKNGVLIISDEYPGSILKWLKL